MKTTTMTSVQMAASRLLDALIDGTTGTLDVTFQEPNLDALERLMTVLHEEARRRGVGVTIEERGENRLCLSLRHP